MPQVTITASGWRSIAQVAYNESFKCASDDAKRDRLRNAATAISKALNGCDDSNRVTLDPSCETILLLVGICATRGVPAGQHLREKLSELEPKSVRSAPVVTKADIEAARAAEAEGLRSLPVLGGGDLE